MNLGLFAMASAFLVTIALLAWEIVASRRTEAMLRSELTYYYEQAWLMRQRAERAELGFPRDVPPYLFPVPDDHETVLRRIGLRPQ